MKNGHGMKNRQSFHEKMKIALVLWTEKF